MSEIQSGWLIELRGSTPSWAIVNPRDYDEHWTEDSTRALRFARREDAQAYIDHIGWTEAFPSEHIWDDGKSALLPPSGAVASGGVEAEREACAKLCETLGEADPDKEDHCSDYLAGFATGYEAAATQFAAAIRARGQ